MIKILKNPTSRVIEVTYDNIITTFKPEEVKPVEENIAKHALEFNNTPLVDVTEGPNGVLGYGGTTTEEKLTPRASGEVTEPKLNSELALMGLPQLLKLAKSKGLKTKFGMKKTEVISLLLNG
jgi:hypothetical protein